MSRIITFSHQKGGVGKSTLAFNLANNLSTHSKVCIVDMDQQGSLAQVGGIVGFDILNSIPTTAIERLEYDFIIIDTPPYLNENLLSLYEISDIIIIPTRAGILDLFAIQKTIELIKEAGQESKAMVVFNLIKPNTKLTSDILKEVREFDVKVSKTFISDLVVFTRSILINGVSESSKAQSQLDDLTEEILIEIN